MPPREKTTVRVRRSTEGDAFYLWDESLEAAIRDAAIVTNAGVAAARRPKKGAPAGLIVMAQMQGDGEVDLALAIGAAAGKATLAKGRWLPVQGAALAIPSGR